MIPLYPDIEPYATHHFEMELLSSGQRHRIYVEECGQPDGIPVLFLHGGPGSGCRPQHRRYFDPNVYRIILVDQRGCGRSTPHGELEHNTTDFLIADLETIRLKLGLSRWLLFGGSWGATLALIYAQRYPNNVLALILRGTFLGRRQDIEWVYAEGGASNLFPDAWQALIAPLDQHERKDILNSYYQRLTNPDEVQQMSAAKTLQAWESTIVTLRDHAFRPDENREPAPLAHSRIQLHFARHACFIADHPILANMKTLRPIPAVIIHGRYDVVCPLKQSWELHQAWPESQLRIVPLAGHAASEPAMIDALVKATQQMAHDLAQSDPDFHV